ncbi:MAG: hypothetical protein U1E54_03380 [Candidatus Levybacteria bacterium]|nr:hypothetical protein [Candidatus Levybacteria bacterium]
MTKNAVQMNTSNMYKFIEEKKEHLHTYEGKPLYGTTSIVGVIKPASPLMWYASGKALEALGFTNSKKVNREDGIKIAGKARKNFFIKNEEYYDWLQECYRAHSTHKDKKADEGTEMHSQLEKYVTACIMENSGTPLAHTINEDTKVSQFIDWALVNVDTFLWSEAHCFSKDLWVGGISDLGFLKNDKLFVGDFKSSKDAYVDQFWQAAGYGLQLKENGALTSDGEVEKKIGFIHGYVVFPFGAEKLEPKFNYDVAGNEEAFKACLIIYKQYQSMK